MYRKIHDTVCVYIFMRVQTRLPLCVFLNMRVYVMSVGRERAVLTPAFSDQDDSLVNQSDKKIIGEWTHSV